MRILSILGVCLLLLVSLASPALAGIEPSPFDVSIPANVQWFSSGVSITSGQTFSIEASGNWATDSLTCGADGNGYPGGAGYIMPNMSAYSLIGKIGLGSGAPFYIGSNYSGTANTSGILYLSMNDMPGNFGDNSGSILATIHVPAPAQPSSSVPGVSFWGNVTLALLLVGAMVWTVRRRFISGGTC